jgi:hypothetical protein
MVKVTILNETGHTELEMNASETIEQIMDHPTHWVYVDGELISRAEVSGMNFEQVEDVTLTQAIVGGLFDRDDEP